MLTTEPKPCTNSQHKYSGQFYQRSTIVDLHRNVVQTEQLAIVRC